MGCLPHASRVALSSGTSPKRLPSGFSRPIRAGEIRPQKVITQMHDLVCSPALSRSGLPARGVGRRAGAGCSPAVALRVSCELVPGGSHPSQATRRRHAPSWSRWSHKLSSKCRSRAKPLPEDVATEMLAKFNTRWAGASSEMICRTYLEAVPGSPSWEEQRKKGPWKRKDREVEYYESYGDGVAKSRSCARKRC